MRSARKFKGSFVTRYNAAVFGDLIAADYLVSSTRADGQIGVRSCTSARHGSTMLDVATKCRYMYPVPNRSAIATQNSIMHSVYQEGADGSLQAQPCRSLQQRVRRTPSGVFRTAGGQPVSGLQRTSCMNLSRIV